MNWNPKAKRVARVILIILATILFALLSMCVALSNDPNHVVWPIETDEPNMTEWVPTQQPSTEPTGTPTPTAKTEETPEPTESEPVKASDEPVETSAQPNAVPTQKPNWLVKPPQQSAEPSLPVKLPSTEPSVEPSEQITHLVIKINNQTSVYGEPLSSLTYTVKSVTGTGVTIFEITKNITISKETGTDAGTYAITGHCSNPKWQVTFENGIYAITKRHITVRIYSQSSYEGSTLNELTYRLEEGTLAKGDKLSNIVKLSTNANKNRAGTYSITGTAIDANYSVTFTGDAKYTVWERESTTDLPSRPSSTPKPTPTSTPAPTPPPPPSRNPDPIETGGGGEIGESPSPTVVPTPPPPPSRNPNPVETGGGGVVGKLRSSSYIALLYYGKAIFR